MQPLAKTLSVMSIVLAAGSAAMAAPVLDGSGFGAPSAVVLYNPAAPESNFDNLGPTTDGASYNIYTRGDATYAYVLLQQTGAGTSAGSFANLYFGTGVSARNGSDVGFEVTNDRAFSPGVSGYKPNAGTGIEFAVLNGGTGIEFAVPFSYFETDPQGIGFDKTTAENPNIILRISQSFGYSAVGGATFGPDRLGLIVDPIGSASVPEPASMALLGAGLVALATRRKRS